jgi:hypothetical protein
MYRVVAPSLQFQTDPGSRNGYSTYIHTTHIVRTETYIYSLITLFLFDTQFVQTPYFQPFRPILKSQKIPYFNPKYPKTIENTTFPPLFYSISSNNIFTLYRPYIYIHLHTTQTLTTPTFKPNYPLLSPLSTDTLSSSNFSIKK